MSRPCADCVRQAEAYVDRCRAYIGGAPTTRQTKTAVGKVARALHELHAAMQKASA